jgi:hypothetical protein
VILALRRVKGVGGNREVPPHFLFGVAEACLEKEGGSPGKHGFPRGSERLASDPPTRELVDFLRAKVAA